MEIFQDFATALTAFPNALLYYLVLISASGIAFLEANRSKNSGSEATKPLRPAFLVVFFAQLILLTLSLLSFQGYSVLANIFPLVYHTLTFITLIWIIWALVAPLAKGWLSRLPLILSCVAFMAGCFSVSFLANQVESLTLNNYWVSTVWTWAALVLLLLGIGLVLFQKRPQKLEGFLVLFIATLGYLIHLIGHLEQNLPAAVMLSQLLYYPLLISIAWQKQMNTIQPTKGKALPPSPELASSFLELSLQTDLEQIHNALTRGLSIFLMSDLLGIVEKTTEKNLRISHTYDLIRETWLPDIELPGDQVLPLLNHFEDSVPLYINDPQQLQEEKAVLMQAFGYNACGNLLLYPLEPYQNSKQSALLCLTPYTNRVWTSEDLATLAYLAPKLEQVLQHASSINAEAQVAEEQRIATNQLQRENTRLVEQAEHAQALLSELRQEYLRVKNAYTSEIQLWTEREKNLEEQIAQLKEALDRQEAEYGKVEELRQQKNELEKALARNAEQLASLKNALQSAEQLLGGLSLGRQEVQPSLHTEDAIEGQTSAQRKVQPLLSGEEIAASLQKTLLEVAGRYSTQQIQLESQINGLPSLTESDLNLMQHALEFLEVNAFAASPKGSKVRVAILPSDDERPDSIEILVSDSGSGLSDEEQRQFLSLLAEPQGDLPAGIGDIQALRQAAELVQAVGGHWWIHSELSEGTSYRVSVPHKMDRNLSS